MPSSTHKTADYIDAELRNPGNKQAGKRAAYAVAHTLIKVIWKVLASGKPYEDLGADFYTRTPRDPEAEARRLIAKAEKLTGKKITLVDPEPQPA